MSDQYRRAMEALARETKIAPTSAARIERELLEALPAGEAVEIQPASGMKRGVWRPRSGGAPITVSGRRWVPAAAAVVLVAGIVFTWWMNRPFVTDEHYEWRAATGSPSPATVDKAADRPKVESAAAGVDHPVPPHRKAAQTQKAQVVNPSGFIELPWTVGLPVFESGSIVRIEVPVASLPAYGFDITGGGGERAVEADVLIGQDGLARAMRLVTNSTRSTQ